MTPATRRRIGISVSVSSRPRASRRSSSLSAARRETFIVGMARERRQRRLCMAQLRKALRQVRACSVFSANQASMSIWPHGTRVLFRSPSHCRNAVACLTCSAANRRMLGVMWLLSARVRSRGRTCQVASARGPGRTPGGQGRRAHPKRACGHRHSAPAGRADGPPGTARERSRHLPHHRRGTEDPARVRDLVPPAAVPPTQPRQRHHAHPAHRRPPAPAGSRPPPQLDRGPEPDPGDLPSGRS